MQRQRLYSPAEANRVLPQVREVVARIAELTAYLPEAQEQVRTAEYMRSRAGAGREELDRLQEALGRLQAAELELSKSILRLEGMGVTLKDPHLGLVDFPSLLEGEVVELCWRLGEERVAHWHRIGEGFPGRKPL